MADSLSAEDLERLNKIQKGIETDDQRAERINRPHGITPEENAAREVVLRDQQSSRGLYRSNVRVSDAGDGISDPVRRDTVLRSVKRTRRPRRPDVYRIDGALQELGSEYSATADALKSLKSTTSDRFVRPLSRLRRPRKEPWKDSSRAQEFLPAVASLESDLEMPKNLLASLIYQESKYDTRAKSHAGALGLMQIMPNYHPDVDPLNPDDAMRYGARFLVKNKQRFGTWEKALAAYNWGPDNLRRHLRKTGGKFNPNDRRLPKETRDYIRKIMQYVSEE